METCSCEHCYNPIVAKGLCDTHYRRQLRHGSTTQTRPSDWGQKEKHPLYNAWGWIRKMRGRHQIESSWEDFWEFVKDVGERPTPQHSLRKYDESLGYVKGNMFWKEQVASTEDRNEYAREWRKANPDKSKNNDLKKYGISLEVFNFLRKSQNYSCAICEKHEDDEKTHLCVDHNHTTGEVRGLLCTSCNTALGGFQDNKAYLQKAIYYLKE